jgi:DNA-binding NarL/FixJ family response regulator
MRILIADDHPVFRQGIQALLAASDEFEVVGEARTGDEAVAMAATLAPDLILMDIAMPGRDGVAATRDIMSGNPRQRILMVTMFDDHASVFNAMRAGALGYVLKDAERSDMLRAVRAVGNGEAIFSPPIAARLIDYFATPPARPAPGPPFPELTAREREVLTLIAAGHGNQDIARTLFLGHNTVRNYVSSIFAKLQVADRAQAIVRAREAGLGGHGA